MKRASRVILCASAWSRVSSREIEIGTRAAKPARSRVCCSVKSSLDMARLPCDRLPKGDLARTAFIPMFTAKARHEFVSGANAV
jgi:hypothetical protein